MSEESAKGDDDNGVAIDGAAPPAIGKKEKSAWRTSPFASKEIGLAANPPAFVASIPRAMGWDSRRNKEYLLGQLLASAIVHGALLCEHFWQPWLNGICGMGREHELFGSRYKLRTTKTRNIAGLPTRQRDLCSSYGTRLVIRLKVLPRATALGSS